jgi:peptidoglycan/xylan/chitin deacetylase (PgdA/CDA1 family)
MLSMASVARAADHAVVLLYHHVADDTPAVTSVTPAQFARHLDYLARHRFHVLPLQELVARIRQGEALPEKSVAITFDDAYRSVFTHAAPLLEKHGWPYTVFVSTDYIDHSYGNYMSWAQMRQLKAKGAAFANHSLSHAHLVRRLAGEDERAWQQRIRHQIKGAQQRLEQELGVKAKMLAYPYGEFSRPLRALVKGLGYTAFGQQSGAIGPETSSTALPRFPLMGHYAEMEAFALRVRVRPLPVSLTGEQRNLLPADERRPELTIRLGQGSFRDSSVRCYYQGKAMPMQWLDEKQATFAIRSAVPLPAGRSKYTCTAPATKGKGIFFWYSHPWVLPKPDGGWPREGGS